MSNDEYWGGGANFDLLGKIPIRTEIEVLSADKPIVVDIHDQIVITSDGRGPAKNKPVLGFRVYERIGISVANTKAISKLSVSK